MGGPDLTLVELDKMMEPLKRQCENAHIIFGAAIDQQYTHRMAVTLITSRRQSEEAKGEADENGAGKASPLQFLDTTTPVRHSPRLAPPAPEMTSEQKTELFKTQSARSRKKLPRLQRELPLEIVFKGRFEKSEPTIRHGEDLDLPTYIRRGVPLN